jgi:gliding motility-associated-like protein
MKRIILLLLLLSFIFSNSFAAHIKGGFISYKYLGPGSTNTLKYRITLTVYMVCDNLSSGQLTNPINLTIFDGNGPTIFSNAEVFITNQYKLGKAYDEPCITDDQRGCYYTIVVYELDNYDLPVSANGYTISYQRCCRIANMDNVENSAEVGNTYTTKIPGTSSPIPDANKNSSPIFAVNDTAVICGGSFFSLSLSATDSDNDSLSYSLCGAYEGGTVPNPAPDPAEPPGYNTVNYTPPYSGFQPLGAAVKIDSRTGLLSGVAPPIAFTGEYVVTVCVAEYRKGLLMGESRKELHIRIKDCVPLQALLNPKPVTCDGFNVTFKNDVTNLSGTEYEWNFGDPKSGINDTSSKSEPAHFFSDTGIYKVKLRVSVGGLCSDSTTTTVKVYPGFFPDFEINPPFCENTLIQFKDGTKTNYGQPTGWKWDFGDLNEPGDTSNKSQDRYQYKNPGIYMVKLIVGNTFGCVDSVSKEVTIRANPVLTRPLNFPNDTLICIIDTLQLKTNAPGSFIWSPNYNISNITSPSPLVSPDIPTTYYAQYTDTSGCKATDSVFINVKAFVTIDAGNDTTICRTDSYFFNVTSDALSYKWVPALYLNSDTAKNPVAVSLDPQITYSVTGSIGKCQSSDNIKITTVPYPAADAGEDIKICIGKSTKLSASGGKFYTWSPATFLTSTNIPDPSVLTPAATTTYTVTVRDNLGCPKPATDQVTVFVRDPKVDIGFNDTSIVLGETIRFNATGSDIYSWTPSLWLSSASGPDPITSPEDNIEYRLTATTVPEGCISRDTVRIKVYKVPEGFYVPTAFSPNGDNLNEILKPIILGMKSFNYFRVYNRGGELIFSTSERGKGWDGSYKGNPQDPGTFVWTAAGVTYKGESIVRKGTAVLIR